MASLQDCGVQQPKRNRGHHLDAGQGMTGKKPAHNSGGIECKAPPQQARNRCEQVGQRRQIIKDGMQMVRLELALLHEVHDARNASERERAIGHQRN